MKASDELHKLIASLSKAEKRHFKLYTSRYEPEKENNYLRLFQAVEKQESYDEEAIKQQFSGETFIRHLPSEKNYLYNQVLDCLHLFYVEHSEEQRLHKRIHHAAILMERGLGDQSLKLLRKAKQAAIGEEFYAIALEAIQMEKTIVARNYFSGITSEELQQLYEEEKYCCQRIQEANEYWLLFSRFYQFHYRKGASRNAADWKILEEIMAHPLLADISQAHSFQTRLDFYHIHALYHFMRGNHAQAAACNKAYLELLESRPEKLKTFAKRYMATLNNYLMDCLGLQQYEEVKAGIAKLRALPDAYRFYRAQSIQADIFRLSSILELNLYIKTADFERGVDNVGYITNQLSHYEGQIVMHNVLTICYLLAYIYFGAGRYSDALRWLNKIINEAEAQVLQDIQAFARIFSLIVHFELKNFDILEYLQASTYRFIAKKNTFYKAEIILFRYLRKLSGIAGKKELLTAYEKLRAELLPLTQDPEEAKAFEYFDLISWLDAKLSGKSFAEVIRDKVVV